VISRRQTLTRGVAAVVVGLVTSPAAAGSYLRRASLLLDGARRDRNMVRARRNDRELLRVVQRVAAARAAAGRDMTVPKAVYAAHPHLLLVLENCERGYAAGLRDDGVKFVERLDRARSEDQTFRAIIARLGFTLPPTR
jgi:hypothetical protein